MVPDGTNTNPATPMNQADLTGLGASLSQGVAQAMAPALGSLGIAAGAAAGAVAGAVSHRDGGGSGSYMFANLEELDGVIRQWQNLVDELEADTKRVDSAVQQIARPAGDHVSEGNYNQSTDVLRAMRKHNEMLGSYAQHYVVKLKECRAQMSTTEQGNQTKMRRVY